MSGACLAIATFGGPTAVLNHTVEGFVREATRHGRTMVVIGGPGGFAQGAIHDVDDVGSVGVPQWSRPGSWLGAGRQLLDDADLDRALAGLVERGVSGLAVVGGNGTMQCCQRMVERAKALGAPLAVVGVPKTIDNDLQGTDRSPGYLSAAAFVIDMVVNLAFDHRAMQSIEQVRVVETLGRNTGWLAMSSLLARHVTGAEPHLVVVPERPFDSQVFADDVERVLADRGRAFVVVAEGAAGSLLADRFDVPAYDRPVEGGVAHVLADHLRRQLGVTARAEVPGLIQRCSALLASPVDRHDARAVGASAARRLAEGLSEVMVAIDGTGGSCEGAAEEALPGRCDVGGRVTTVPLAHVAGRTRHVPSAWLADWGAAGDGQFCSWLGPLVRAPAT